MECAALCYAAAQLMSLGSEKQKTSVDYAQSFAKNVEANVATTRTSIARNVRELVKDVRRNAEKWQPKIKYMKCIFIVATGSFFTVDKAMQP